MKPRIRATARTGQKLHENVAWAIADRFEHLVARGSVEDLRVHVSRPEEFIENQRNTSVVVVDATARAPRRGEGLHLEAGSEPPRYRLRVRHTSEGSLELVTGFEPWSFSVEAGEGIPTALAEKRDEIVKAWQGNEPPVPSWEFLERNTEVDDLEPEPSNEEPVFEMAVRDLALTEHQKAMLEPPEERIENLVFSASIQARARENRQRGRNRKNEWASKFRGLFAGKTSQKCAERLSKKGWREELEGEIHQKRREELANELAIENTELVMQGELGSVLAVLLEIEERVGLPEDAVGNGDGGRSSIN